MKRFREHHLPIGELQPLKNLDIAEDQHRPEGFGLKRNELPKSDRSTYQCVWKARKSPKTWFQKEFQRKSQGLYSSREGRILGGGLGGKILGGGGGGGRFSRSKSLLVEVVRESPSKPEVSLKS